MYNLNLLALCLVLIYSHSAATTGEGELVGLFGGIITAMSTEEEAADPTTMLDNIPYLSQDPTISSVAHTNVTTSDSADDNPEYVKVSSAFQEHSMGIYKLQELRVNGFPVWKKIGHKLDTYLFVPTCSEVESENIAGCGRWTIGYGPELESIFSDYRRAQLNLRAHGIGPEIDYKAAWLYLPQAQPVPKSPVNSQGWLYVAKKKCTLMIFECINWKVDWKTDNTIKVEAFTGGYEINSTGGASEHHPALMGRYLLTPTIMNDYPVYEIENKGWYIYVESNGYWAVGEDLKSGYDGMYQNNGNDPTPENPAGEGWVFWNYDDGEWQSDPTITFQFVTDL